MAGEFGYVDCDYISKDSEEKLKLRCGKFQILYESPVRKLEERTRKTQNKRKSRKILA
jgi:hypothetical protein